MGSAKPSASAVWRARSSGLAKDARLRERRGRRRPCILRQAFVAQRNIGMALDAAQRIPVGGAMAQKAIFIQTSSSTITGTWSEAFCQPRIFFRMVWDFSAPFRPGLSQT